jgi:hypothetical protein
MASGFYLKVFRRFSASFTGIIGRVVAFGRVGRVDSTADEKKIKMVDASAYFLSRGLLRIFTKPTPPPAISVSVICDRIALIAHTLREGLI